MARGSRWAMQCPRIWPRIAGIIIGSTVPSSWSACRGIVERSESPFNVRLHPIGMRVEVLDGMQRKAERVKHVIQLCLVTGVVPLKRGLHRQISVLQDPVF